MKHFIYDRLVYQLSAELNVGAYKLYMLLLKHSNTVGVIDNEIEWGMIQQEYESLNTKQDIRSSLKELQAREYIHIHKDEGNTSRCKIIHYIDLIYSDPNRKDNEVFNRIRDDFSEILGANTDLRKVLNSKKEEISNLKSIEKELKQQLKEKRAAEFNPVFKNASSPAKKFIDENHDFKEIWAFAILLKIEYVFCKMTPEGEFDFNYPLFNKWKKICPMSDMKDIFFTLLSSGELLPYTDDEDMELNEKHSKITKILFSKFKHYKEIDKVKPSTTKEVGHSDL